MFIKVRNEPAKFQPRRAAISEDGKSVILVNKKTDAIVELARKEAIDPDKPYRTEKTRGFEVRQIPNIIDSVFSERLVYHLIGGWELKKKDLRLIFDPERIEITHDGNPDDPVPFTEDLRSMMAKFGDDAFRGYVLQVAVDSQAFFDQVTSEEIKN